MAFLLRDYQEQFALGVFDAWSRGQKNVLGVMPTGAGKAKTGVEIVRRFAQPTCIMVHRGELVAQLSETLAEAGITHRVVASKSTVAMCVARHVKKFGRSFVHDQSPIGVASVQTLVKRLDRHEQWLNNVRLMFIDEAHHTIAAQYITILDKLHEDCRTLGLTATPDRCDRKSLARSQKGVFDELVEGPTPAWLMEQGYLAKYRYFAPPPSIHMDDEDISDSTGEFKADAIRKKSHESRIVGDIVDTYLNVANGLQAIVFVVDIETATQLASAFNAAGVPASAVSGKTPDSTRLAIMDKFATKVLRVVINVDLFDEGLDIPGVDAVIMGRPSMSLGKVRQQIGRALRPVYAPGYDLSTQEGRLAAQANGTKPYAIIIDHVENYKRHKFPDTHRVWNLVRPDGTRKAKNRDDEIPLRSCEACYRPYEAVHKCCPHCGHKPEPLARSAPEHVDGDIIEFDSALIAKLSGEINRVDGAPQIPDGASDVVRYSIEKRWRERQAAQALLREAIALWAGYGKAQGKPDSELYRLFFFRFKIDVLTAQTLGATEAEELRQRVIADMPTVHLPGVIAA